VVDVPDYSRYLADAASRWPTRTALRYQSTAWTYRELHEAVDLAALNLSDAGIGSGTRVLLLLENRPEYLLAQFALARLRAVFVTPNPYWTDTELLHSVAVSGATAAVYEPRYATLAATLRVALAVDTLLQPSGSAMAYDETPLNPVAPLYIPFSSGTTGLPKGVLHTASSLCGGVNQLRDHLALTCDDRLQLSLPLCHIFGSTMSAAAISVGAELTLFRRFDLQESLRHLRENAVTVWPLAGAVAATLLDRGDLDPNTFASLRFFMWGGSAVPAEIARELTIRTGVRFLCSYGMTEAMMVAFNPVAHPDQWRLDSPGSATAGTELRLREDGELEVRGPSVALGYAGLSSADFAADGWFRTGDRARVDADGRLHILDRAKDMLKVSGFQVAPTEVEQVLCAHPGVADAGVIGRPDRRTGEAVVAYVVRTSDTVTESDLITWAARSLATYKVPRAYHFVLALPRTSAGKLRRGALKEQAGDQPRRS
jgi:long-chain acyl-CoA synthetase